MKIITDDVEIAESFFYEPRHWSNLEFSEIGNPEVELLDKLELKSPMLVADFHDYNPWETIIIASYAPKSQYDALIELSKEVELPNVMCLAASGDNFRGFRNRKWDSRPGNIYMTTHLKPNREIPRFNVGFLVLAALSVAEAIDSIEGLKTKAKIKWVNDIFMEESKVSGVLDQTQIMGSKVVGAIMGIGMNVETSPIIEPTPFVPAAACVDDFAEPGKFVTRREAFAALTKRLAFNYEKILAGDVDYLTSKYIEKSYVIGMNAEIWSDGIDTEPEVLRFGKIEKIGENLELFFEGDDRPVTNGRLRLLS